MKTFAQFKEETHHLQERMDATVYGQLTLGATPGTATKQQIKSGVDRAIKNVGKKEGSGSIGTKGSYGIKPSGYVSLSYEKKSGSGKTPPPTKIRPDKTTDPKTPKTPKTPKNTKDPKTIKTVKTVKTVKAIKGNGGRPNKTSNDVRPIKTSTPPPSTSSSSTNVLTKGSNTSSPSSTKVLTKKPTQSPSSVDKPVRIIR